MNEIARVQEEDATLVSLLEDLVPRFDVRYDTHEGGLQSFVDKVLRPEMKVVLNRLKREDEAAHAAGRREMGVIMVEERKSDVDGGYEGDSNEESESESDDESEGDSLEDYGTDSLDEYESDAHEDD
ncbi:hypothetical protein J4E89_004578 [Alternaria sp. Ai002NY15]|nr:hypothetical protein J4E89_004578 [Alternaria sp. Ai002NY15]